jgi:hypothetical protein
MLKFAKQYPEVFKYLPAEIREVDKLPRKYVATLLYSIIGSPFDEWVQKRVTERDEKIAEQQDLYAEMDPEVYAALQNSTSISGKFIQLNIIWFKYSPQRKFP